MRSLLHSKALNGFPSLKMIARKLTVACNALQCPACPLPSPPTGLPLVLGLSSPGFPRTFSPAGFCTRLDRSSSRGTHGSALIISRTLFTPSAQQGLPWPLYRTAHMPHPYPQIVSPAWRPPPLTYYFTYLFCFYYFSLFSPILLPPPPLPNTMSMFPFNSIRFCFMYFENLLLSAYTFRIFMSFSCIVIYMWSYKLFCYM